MLRHVAEVERLLIQQDFEAAEARLTPLIEQQPTVPRLLELLSQIATAQNRPERIGEWIRRHLLTPQDLPASTIFLLANALKESASIEDKNLEKIWIEIVSSRQLQGDEVKRAALALRKMGRDEEAVRLITNLISRTPNSLTIPAMLYDIRARAKIDLAKRCMDTGKSRVLDKSLKAKAWEQCRRYLEEAELDIVKAVESEPNAREREFYGKDLEFVRSLMAQSQKPERNSPQHQDRSHRNRNIKRRYD
jgi:tetratricopeptide (TPR) repeat protein